MAEQVQLYFNADAIPSMAGEQFAVHLRQMHADHDGGCAVEVTIRTID